MEEEVGKKDLAVISCLRQNARQTLGEIGKKVGMPVSSVYEKVKRASNCFVKKYAAIVDFSKLGFSSRATIILKVDKVQKAEIGQFLGKHQNVNSLFKINNGYDFLIDVVFRQMAHLEEFIEQLERKFRIKHKEVYFIIDEVKQESFLDDPQTASIVAGR